VTVTDAPPPDAPPPTLEILQAQLAVLQAQLAALVQPG
jgi:hypothetical protein